MTWSEKLAEIGEIFSALGGAFVVLCVIGWLIDITGSRRARARKGRDRDAGTLATQGVASINNTAELEEVTGSSLRSAYVKHIYIANNAGQPVRRVPNAVAVAGKGLQGDRYGEGCGHWSQTDDCQLTLIADEDLDQISREYPVRVQHGEHRRNLVTRNIMLEDLVGKRFRIGNAWFGYDAPRPPCAYIQMVSEAGMTKALGGRAGICVRCIESGSFSEGDIIEISEMTVFQALQHFIRTRLRQGRAGGHG